jgi:hypothetical protein
MAAGVIYQTVTTTNGETVELAFYVDNTASPTTWIPFTAPGSKAGVPYDTGAGTSGTATQRTIIDSSQLGTLGQAAKTASVPVVPASDWTYNTGYYVTVAASQTDQVIQSSTGAAGDYMDHVVVVPNTTAGGLVTIKDNATALISYPGATGTALLTLTPFVIYVGAVSRSGAWKITTGANTSCVAVGRFS